MIFAIKYNLWKLLQNLIVTDIESVYSQKKTSVYVWMQFHKIWLFTGLSKICSLFLFSKITHVSKLLDMTLKFWTWNFPYGWLHSNWQIMFVSLANSCNLFLFSWKPDNKFHLIYFPNLYDFWLLEPYLPSMETPPEFCFYQNTKWKKWMS